MANTPRKSKVEYEGKEVWCRIDKSTGEILEKREVDTFRKQVSRREPFMITYLAEIISLIDTLGNKKMQVVKYILQHMNKSENTLIITTRELAEKCKVSKPVVLETLQILEQAGIIKRRTGAIMVSGKLMNNKNATGEAILMTKYVQFSDKEKDNQESDNVTVFPTGTDF